MQQRLVIDIDEQYINLIVDLLSNLKENIIKNITIETQQVKPIDKNIIQLNRFHKLIAKSNNQIPLTMKIATDTSGMVDDGLF
jgi:predicted methyltransferase